jgi:urea-proton symporter
LTQWPEDFDFVSTRALNVKVPASTVTGPYNDEKTNDSEKVSEKEDGFADTHSASAVNDDGLEPDPDLDPASLHKAFRFAAWSSVALVRSLSPLPCLSYLSILTI